jgi:hypothetical protein
MTKSEAKTQVVSLHDDGETGRINEVVFRSRTLHRLLSETVETKRETILLDVLNLGAELLARAGRQGELDDLSRAVERLDEEAKAIVGRAAEQVDRSIEKSLEEMTVSLQSAGGPFAALLERFDVQADGNVIDLFRDLVSSTANKAMKQAVNDLTETTRETIERLTRSMATLEKVAAAEEARLAEAQRGTAKGLRHELDTESLLGELVSVTGDSLDDVSTVIGLEGTKKGDKTITPRGGSTIVTEEKCTVRMTEAKARVILAEAMANRGAALGMLIVDDESKVPGNQPFHLIEDDMVVVVAERATLRLIYAFFRAKAIEIAHAQSCSSDDDRLATCVDRIRLLVEEIGRAVERFRLLRTEHTKAFKAVDQANRYVDEISGTISEGVLEVMAIIESLAIDTSEIAA